LRYFRETYFLDIVYYRANISETIVKTRRNPTSFDASAMAPSGSGV